LFTGVNGTAKNFSAVSTTPAIRQPTYISLPTPENEKYTKILSLGVKYTQLSSSQKILKNHT
jgi:hypothetical protein